MNDGPEWILNKFTGGGGGELKVGFLEPVEGLGKKQDLPIHVRFILISEIFLDCATEGEGNDVDAFRLLGGGTDEFRC